MNQRKFSSLNSISIQYIYLQRLLVEKTSHLNMMSDNTGNKIEWFPENDRQLRIIFRLGGGAAHQQNLCMSLINDVFLPLRSVIGMLYFSRGGIYYYLGDNYCPENRKPLDKCMSYLNVNNILFLNAPFSL